MPPDHLSENYGVKEELDEDQLLEKYRKLLGIKTKRPEAKGYLRA